MCLFLTMYHWCLVLLSTVLRCYHYVLCCFVWHAQRGDVFWSEMKQVLVRELVSNVFAQALIIKFLYWRIAGKGQARSKAVWNRFSGPQLQLGPTSKQIIRKLIYIKMQRYTGNDRPSLVHGKINMQQDTYKFVPEPLRPCVGFIIMDKPENIKLLQTRGNPKAITKQVYVVL